jgi:AsmA protein
MKRVIKWIAIIVALLIVLVVALPFVINVNTFRPRIESELTSALGRKVEVGNLSLSVWSGSLGADNISIADDPGFANTPFVKADSFKVGVNMIPLIFSKKLEIRDITLTHPQVTLLRSPAGKWNFSSLGNSARGNADSGATQSRAADNKTTTGSSSIANQTSSHTAATSAANESQSEQGLAQSLSVGELNIRGGQITVADTNAPKRTRVYQNVDASVKGFSFATQFPFTPSADLPGGGNAKLDGTAGPINHNDAALTPMQAKISVNQLDLAKSGFIDPASGFAGSVNFSGTVESDGSQAHSSGDATAEHLKLSPKGTPAARPVMMKYATAYDLQKQTGQLTQGDVSVGKAVAKLGGTYDLHGESAALDMKLNADKMPVDDLQTLLPAMGVELPKGSSLQGGTLSADLSVVGPVDKLVINGPVKLADTKLAGFSMASKLSSILSLGGAKTGSDTTIQNFSSDVHVSPAGIQIQNVSLIVPSLGTVTGNGTISPQNALDYKMSASLSGSLGGGLTSVAGGKGGIPFFIQGTASDPKFVPDVKGMVSGRLGQLGVKAPNDKSVQGLTNAVSGLFGKKKKQP